MNRPVTFEEFAILLREWIHLSATGSQTCLEDLDSTFDRLAVSLFRLQFTQNATYRKLCEARKIAPCCVRHWTEIPAVPTSAFKIQEVTCLSSENRARVFHSSGTTGQVPSRHFHSPASLDLYEASVWPWFARHMLPEIFTDGKGPARHLLLRNQTSSSPPEENRVNVVAKAGRVPETLVMLSPRPLDVPHSSLAHMFSTVNRSRQWNESVFVGEPNKNGSWAVNAKAAVDCLERASELKGAIVILGTAFSFVQLLDRFGDLGLRFQLPKGSRVMETGGYKGRSRVLTRQELHAVINERLGVPAENIVCEYGMSELSSQAYDRVAENEAMDGNRIVRCFHFPPWVRVQVVSPETGCEVAEGETGLIRVFDLANVYSALAVHTEDLGIRRGNGFELIGRAKASEPRGCSLVAA